MPQRVLHGNDNTLHIGGEEIRVIYPGANHEAGNVLIHAHDAILELDFDRYVGGHVHRTGTGADVEQSRAFFVDLWNITKKNMGTIPFTADSAGSVVVSISTDATINFP
ncbi:hypothetical protein [Streptomyces sp. NBC_01092]|uniref:hypothetical protein n=1 Tax=Streptomyces sp. NBC_01092 TaxID=2903748 RepID=UPI0038647E0D|nr:hypothetical protein OG254_08240 [Streptomyces sp. NBC_01092]